MTDHLQLYWIAMKLGDDMELQSIRVKIYDKFKCKADRCKHTCCKGWEVEIDPYTYELYKKMTGELGDKIRNNVVSSDGSYHFKLTEDNKCPMLDDKGLCQIIAQKGEDELCDICNNHPRFYGSVNGVELMGIGLSCEKTCELLDREDNLKFIASFMDVKDGNATLVEKTYDLEDVVDELNMEFIIDGTRTSNDEVFDDLYYMSHAWDDSLVQMIVEFYGETEPIDEYWVDIISHLKNSLSNANDDIINKYNNQGVNDYYNKIFQYILFRQLDCASEYEWSSVVGYALMATDFIRLWDAVDGRDFEHVRRWSEQIEYSDENVELLITG